MKATKSFSSLSKQHDELQQLFVGHQRALFAKDVDAALSIITTFGSVLNRHIDYEEQRLLPLYADLGAETAGGTSEIFQAEHRKLRDSLTSLMRRTEGLQGLHSSNDLSDSIIALLDEEAAFKGLLHHHASREQNLLFPRLDERSTEEERNTWLTND